MVAPVTIGSTCLKAELGGVCSHPPDWDLVTLLCRLWLCVLVSHICSMSWLKFGLEALWVHGLMVMGWGRSSKTFALLDKELTFFYQFREL